MQQHFQPLRRNGDEQSAGSLRVESQVHRRLVHARRNVNRVADIFAVPLNRAWNHALPESVHRAVERWQRIGENFRAEPAWSEHPPQMREEAKARDVRAGRRARFLHRVRRRPVQRGHGNFSRRHAGRIIAPNLAAKRQHTRAQRLGEDQRVAGIWFFQRVGHGGIDHARDGKTKFDFIILDAVSADERDAGLLENLHRAVEHLKNNFARQFFGGKRQHAQRRARFAAHRVDVRKAIRRADFSEEPGIVHARREHVHRLHEAKVVCNPVNRRVIGGGQPGNHRGIFHRWQPAQHRVQISGRDLRGAAGVAHELRQFYL